LWGRQGSHSYRRISEFQPLDARVTYGMDVTPDWRSLFVAGSGGAGVYDISDPATPTRTRLWPYLWIPPPDLGYTALDHTGSMLAVAHYILAERGDTADGSELQLLDVSDGQDPRFVEYGMKVGGDGVFIGQPAFSPTRPVLAVPMQQGINSYALTFLDLDDPHDAQAVTFHTGSAAPPRFSADGRRVVAAGTRGGASLWDVSNPANPREHPIPASGTVWTAALSADGRLIALSTPGTATTVWRVSTDGRVRRVGALPGRGEPLDFSPDSRLLAVGSGDRVQLWKVG
ncbi:WD40 repeat domain-containing protein, partial [Streptomyces sp. MCAF7]